MLTLKVYVCIINKISFLGTLKHFLFLYYTFYIHLCGIYTYKCVIVYTVAYLHVCTCICKAEVKLRYHS